MFLTVQSLRSLFPILPSVILHVRHLVISQQIYQDHPLSLSKIAPHFAQYTLSCFILIHSNCKHVMVYYLFAHLYIKCASSSLNMILSFVLY